MSAGVVARVFRSNWLSFYGWKEHDARQSLAVLLAAAPEDIAEDDEDDEDDEDGCEDNEDGCEDNEITVYDYSSSPNVVTVLPAEVVAIPSALAPCPHYTSTTPLRRSILVGDDLNPMPFVPFSDDGSFPHEAHMDEHYETFGWHHVLDPDCEWLLLPRSFTHGTSRGRLRADHQGSHRRRIQHDPGRHSRRAGHPSPARAQHPSLHRRPQTVLSPSHPPSSSPIQTTSDYPSWPPSDPLLPATVPYSPHYSSHLSPSQTLTDILQHFCLSDCFYGYCNTHNCTPSVFSQSRSQACLQTNQDHFLPLSHQHSQIWIYTIQSQTHAVNTVSSLRPRVCTQYVCPSPSFPLKFQS